MPAAKASSQVSAFTLDGTNLLASLTDLTFTGQVLSEMGHGINTQETKACPQKLDSRCSFTINVAGSNCPKDGLSLTAMSVDAENVLATNQSFTMSISVASQRTDGNADWNTYRTATERTVTYTFDWQVASAAASIGQITSMLGSTASTLSDLVMAVSVGFGGTTYTQNCLIKSADHTMTRGGIQTYKTVLESRELASAPASGTDVIAVALIGDALLTVAADTDAGTYDGVILIESVELTVSNGSLAKITGSGFFQGAVTYAATV